MLSRSELNYLEDIEAFEKERGIYNAKTVRSRIRKQFRIAKEEIIFILDRDGYGIKKERGGGKGKQRIIDLHELEDLVKSLVDYTGKYVVIGKDTGTGTIKIEERNKDVELELINTTLEIIKRAQREWESHIAILKVLDKDNNIIYDAGKYLYSDYYLYLIGHEKLMEARKERLLNKWKK